jgi:nitrile hydratase subunit alpha
MKEKENENENEKGVYQPLSYFQLMEVTLRELLVEKGFLTEEQVAAEVENMRARSPERGARVVARAWMDSDFRENLLENGSRACEALGYEVAPMRLVVVENTPQVHNVIVCTLCSCYPRPLLGIPPEWYKSRAYRSRMVREPREVLKEFGLSVGEETAIRVHDSTADMRYMVLPMRPAGTQGWSEEQLAGIVDRDSMIGVSVPRAPRK